MSSDAGPTFTVPPEPSADEIRREKRLNRVGFMAVVAVVVVAAVGLAGVRTSVASERSGLYRVAVTHPSIARPGLAAPLEIAIAPLSGVLPRSVTIRIDARYLAMFDEHGLTPTPAATYRDSEWAWWTFEVPGGRETLEVSLDARVEPSVQWRRAGTVALMSGTRPEAEVHLVTWILP